MLGITNVSNAPSIVLKNTVVSSWTSGSYNGYSYRGTIPITGVTADTIAEVTFSQAQAESGNYSSVCTTYDGGLYVYSKVNTTITIPSIIIHSIVETYYEMDNSPVSGSTKAVTSGGIYSALSGKLGNDVVRTDVTVNGCNISMMTVGGKICVISMFNETPTTTGDFTLTLPFKATASYMSSILGNGQTLGMVFGTTNSNIMNLRFNSTFVYQGMNVIVV